MLEESYEQLNIMERETFKRIANQLLGKTFVVNNIYDTNQKRMVLNADYRFIQRNIELFRQFLGYGGWKLVGDSNYEVIYVTSEYGYNKARLDKNTTLLLYGIRLLFEEQREGINLTEQIIVTVSDIVSTLIEVGAYSKKPTNIDLKTGLRNIMNFNIIQKLEGALEDAETKIIILPSILFAITTENITKISKNLKEMEYEEEDDTMIGEDIE